jgi:hypothetical protein
MGERARGGAPARGRHRRCRSLGDRIARAAGIFRPDMTNDLEVSGHIVQHLGHVLAEPGHSLAACRAGTRAIVLRLMHDIVSRQMIGQRLAFGPGTFAERCRLILGFSAGDVFSLAALQFLEPEFELLDLAADPLRRPAKLHSPQLGDLELQLLDLQRLELHRRLCRLQLALTGQREDTQFGGIVRQIGRGERHAIIYRDRSCRTRTNIESVLCQTSIGRIGNAGAIVRRQSIASISTENCAGVSVIAPSTMGGQTKRPFSSRLAISQSPLPSQ